LRLLRRAGATSSTALPDRLPIIDALTHLSGQHRHIIHRAYYQGWTTAQIAAELQTTERIARGMLHCALHELRLTLLRRMERG
jgi:RNA polymerase sigma-70 factor, ECF subfamily